MIEDPDQAQSDDVVDNDVDDDDDDGDLFSDLPSGWFSDGSGWMSFG